MEEITVNSEADTDLKNVLRSSKKPQEAPGADHREEQRRLLGGKVPSCFPIHLVLCVNSVQTWGEEFHPLNWCSREKPHRCLHHIQVPELVTYRSWWLCPWRRTRITIIRDPKGFSGEAGHRITEFKQPPTTPIAGHEAVIHLRLMSYVHILHGI